MKVLEWPQACMPIARWSRAEYPVDSGGIWPKFKLIQAFLHDLDTCKNEEDPIKTEVARVATTSAHYKSMGIFPDAQWQVTPQYLIGSVRISNSSETLRLSSLTARMKKIHSNMKAIEWPQVYLSIFHPIKGR